MVRTIRLLPTALRLLTRSLLRSTTLSSASGKEGEEVIHFAKTINPKPTK
jgi:hypothetical protein